MKTAARVELLCANRYTEKNVEGTTIIFAISRWEHAKNNVKESKLNPKHSSS
jgi:hypothetical protein